MQSWKPFFVCHVLFFSIVLYATANGTAWQVQNMMGVCIENEGKKLVLIYRSEFPQRLHTSIDLERIRDLEYKTRVMRYFGGMVKNDTYHFERIQVVWEDQDFEMDFTRANVSTILNSIMAHIE